ncbi:MAG: zeta toxin family protein [Gammaproteobacteria bacterium]|nr:zeta toxin family protein [Gammaproteobacteria bacterium]
MAPSQMKLVVFAGPNGSGKSSITEVKRKAPDFPENYINADAIAKSLVKQGRYKTIEAANKEAADEAGRRREDCLNRGVSFAFETVLSTPGNVAIIAAAKERGFQIEVHAVTLHSPEKNVARVAHRVAANGHAVPAKKIIQRYHRSMEMLPIAIALADKATVYDNSKDHISGPTSPSIIMTAEKGQITKIDKTSQVAVNIASHMDKRTESLLSALDFADAQHKQLRTPDLLGQELVKGRICDETNYHFVTEGISGELVVHDKFMQLDKQGRRPATLDEAKEIARSRLDPPASGIRSGIDTEISYDYRGGGKNSRNIEDIAIIPGRDNEIGR